MLKIQFLNGGLANQAFQYIFARHYELSHPGEIMYMDDSYFALNTVHNGYELEKVFGIKPHMLSELFDADVWEYILTEKKKGKSVPQIILDLGEDICMISGYSNYKNFNPFDGEVLIPDGADYNVQIQNINRNAYYHGYWINKGWFCKYKDIFLKEFVFPPIQDDKKRELLQKIVSGRSVSIHIRRGDFIAAGFAYAVEEYRNAVDEFIKCFSSDWTIYVFSDDIAWCRENCKGLGLDLFNEKVYVEGNINGKNYIDMFLMSKCKGMILSNSAFCYLAALLNTDKECAVNTTDREL